MNKKQKLVTFLMLSVTVVAAALVVVPGVYAQQKCGGVDTTVIACTQPGGDNVPIDQSGTWGLLLLILNIMTAGVGILAVGGIAYGAVLYSSAGDKAEQTKKAVTIITNVVIGIVAYGLMYSVLQYLVPGGVFN